MVPVSDAWITMQQQTLLPEMYIEITYTATDPALESAATVSANSNAYISDLTNLVSSVDKRPEKYASLEDGFWGLDGSFGYQDGSPTDVGYVSGSLSTGDARFSSPPTITISFSNVQSAPIPGLTITWSRVFNEWATEFRVTAYSGSTQVAQTTVMGNTSPLSTVWLPMENYNKITVEILAWSHPYHRVRCTEIFLGVATVYEKGDLMGFEHSQSADLLAAALPKNEITFRLRNEDNRWNPDNPTGNEQYLLERQEIRLRYGMDIDGEIEWIKGGTFWLSEWSTPSNGLEASFTARDLFEFMHEGYTGSHFGTLYSVAEAALIQAALPLQDDGSPRYVIDESLKMVMVDFDGDYTIAEVLQMVAHAGTCVIYQDRDGVVQIKPWTPEYSRYVIDRNISYAHPEYEFIKPLKAISVGYGFDGARALVEVADRGEVQTVDNPLVYTQNDALRVGQKAREILENRKSISGEFRADVRLDVLDPVIVESKYATNIVGITDLRYSTTGGAIKATYTGRVVSVNLETEANYSNEFYAGEIY